MSSIFANVTYFLPKHLQVTVVLVVHKRECEITSNEVITWITKSNNNNKYPTKIIN